MSLQRYDFSEPQSGKDICDRILCPLKGAIRRFCNEGHDVLTASDMHTALKESPVRGCTAAVCLVNETKKDLDIKKLQQFSAVHEFSYQQDGLRRHSKLALPNLFRGMKFTLSIKALPISQQNRRILASLPDSSTHDNGDAESSCESGQVLESPVKA